jgi:hypothetical protein
MGLILLGCTMSNSLDVANIHEHMVRNVFLNVELLLNDGVRSISEYDVQSFVFLYFARHLRNTAHATEREREGKVDCVLYENDSPRAFYEIKTYFKPHEWITKEHFDKDIDKMASLLRSHKTATGYILVAGIKSKFKSEELLDFEFISKHLRFDDRSWHTYQLPGGQVVRLRPSQKQHRGQSVLVSWEVKASPNVP